MCLTSVFFYSHWLNMRNTVECRIAERRKDEKVMRKVHRYAHGRGRNYDLTYDLIRRRFVRVFSRVCRAKWSKTGCARANQRFRPNRAGLGMLELDWRLKSWIRVCACVLVYARYTRTEDTLCKSLMRNAPDSELHCIAMIIFLPKYRRPRHFNSMFILLAPN